MGNKRILFFFLIGLVAAAFPAALSAEGVEDFYNVEVKFEANKDEMYVVRIFRKLCEEKGVEPPFWDQMLSAAAVPISKKMAENGMKELDVLDNESLSESIRKFGGTDSAIRTQVANMFLISDAEEIIRKQLIDEYAAGRFTHLGVSVESRLLPPMKYMTLILSRRPVLLQPFPRKVMPGEKKYLKGTLYKDAMGLEILLAKPSGDIQKIKPEVSPDGVFRQAIPFDEGGGKYTIEVQISGSRGPEVAALFIVESLADPTRASDRSPLFVVPDLPPEETEAEAEARLFFLINSARQSAGKVYLERVGTLDQVARDYARQMSASGAVSHVSPDGKDVSHRVKEAGIRYQTVAENIAVNESVIEAHKNLMQSPAHAAMILDNRFTQVGVGVVFKQSKNERRVYVVEIFMNPR